MLKTALSIAFAFALSFVLVSCGNNEEKEKQSLVKQVELSCLEPNAGSSGSPCHSSLASLRSIDVALADSLQLLIHQKRTATRMGKSLEEVQLQKRKVDSILQETPSIERTDRLIEAVKVTDPNLAREMDLVRKGQHPKVKPK